MSQLNDKHLPAMLRAAQTAQIPPSELKLLNPVTQKGQRAVMLLAALEMNDPDVLAEMRAEANEGATLETAAVRAGLLQMTPSAHATLMATDGDYVRKQQEKAVEKEQDLLSSMERMTAESRRKRLVTQLGSEDAADRAMFAEEQREKAKEQEAKLAADRDRELNKRIAQKQAEIQRGFELARASATGVMPQ